MLPWLVCRLPADAEVPLFVFAASYDPLQLALDLADTRAAILVRLRRDRCFSADPPLVDHRPQGGRPARHGAKFACADPATWRSPTQDLQEEDDLYGTLTPYVPIVKHFAVPVPRARPSICTGKLDCARLSAVGSVHEPGERRRLSSACVRRLPAAGRQSEVRNAPYGYRRALPMV
jgi:hypothetical protein